jgi:phospholipid/cholesterol/gamma-HCH transport system permease protein
MNPRASSAASILHWLNRFQHGVQRWLLTWWRILRFALLMLTLAITPASYRREQRQAIARHVVLASTYNLVWFSVLASLISLILIRIVVVTALSYGLSQYALEMVVRVLVIELIPLTAALFVALRVTLPDGLEFAQLRAGGALAAMEREGVDVVRREFLPRVLAGLFSVWLLAAVSCVATLVLAYLSIYGFTPWALNGYTRVVGQVFNPAVAAILLLKILFFSFGVALIPMASSYHDGTGAAPASWRPAAHGLSDMVRLFSVILLVELISLMENYY